MATILSDTDDSVDALCQSEASFGWATAVVTGDIDHDTVPNIGPVRVMIEFFSDWSDSIHERPGVSEVGVGEFAVQMPIDHFPIGNAR
jgi:hypothetical protein